MDISLLNNFKILLLENSIGIYYDMTDNWIYINWTEKQDLNTIKYGCEQLLHILQNQPCAKLLNDNTNVTDDWSEAAEWLMDDFSPRLSKTGLKYLAWIFPPDQNNSFAAEKVLQRMSATTIAISFDNLQTAKAWLHSV